MTRFVASNLIACGYCPRGVGGHQCGATGASMLYQAEHGVCPEKRFGLPVQPIPADYDPEAERRRLQSGGCCGTPSKT